MKTADINELLAHHTVEAVSTGGITELVRGTDKQLIERLTPLRSEEHTSERV